MKRLYITFLALLLANASTVVTAQTIIRVEFEGLSYDLNQSNREASVADVRNSNYDKYVIPDVIKRSPAGLEEEVYTVTSIDPGAFWAGIGYDGMPRGTLASSIVLPNTIKSIGSGAFSYSRNLTQMVIPSSVETMSTDGFEPESHFKECNSLQALIYLPSKAPSFWEASANTYVPDIEEYSSPTLKTNNAKVIEILTFNDKVTTYGETVNINDCKVNIADCGYNLTSLTAKNGLNTNVGEWCDTLRAQFTNDDPDVPVLEVDIPFRHTVTKATLTVKVESVARNYGEVNPTFKVVYSGFVNGEDESVLEEPVKVSVNADENSPVGNYTISLSGGRAKNYDIVYEPGVLIVTKAPLTARVKNVERTYGAPNPGFQIEYTGLKNGETAPAWSVEPTIGTTATVQSNVGDYAITATGGVARDYELTAITPGRLTVTKAPLQVSVGSAQRFYYEENPTFRCVYSGFVNGENESALTKQPTATTTAGLTSKAGSYPIKIGGGEARNYDFAYNDGELTIMKRSLTVTSPDYERPYNEENPAIELSYAGFVGNETEAVLTQKPTATFNATRTSDVGVYNTIISGGEADNYDFVYNGGTLTITKANQTLTWEQDLSQVAIGSQIELTATASSGLEVTYLVPDNNFASLYKAGTRTLLDCYGPGTLVIRAVQEGNGNYYSSERLSKTLTIVDPTGISNATADGYKLYTTPGAIHIANVPEGTEAHVYSSDGVLLYRGRDGKIEVQSGTYIVAVGKETTKLLVK